MKNIIFFLLILFLSTNSIADQNSTPASQSIITGTVRNIVDGDTLYINDSSRNDQKIRLYGIDCPEPKQAYGAEAKEKLRSIVDGKMITIIVTGHDRYGRVVGIVLKDSVDVGLSLVKSGYAWAYRKYLGPEYLTKYIEAESYAKNKKLGLWEKGNAVEPWNYRRKNN